MHVNCRSVGPSWGWRLVRACTSVLAVLWLGAAFAGGDQPDGILPEGNDPLPLVHRQSLYAGYLQDQVGAAVSLSGDLLAVGVPGADSGDLWDTGRVDVYRWFDEAGGWFPIIHFTTQEFGIAVSANARFGAAVALSADWLLIGCPGCAAADNAKAILVQIPALIEEAHGPQGGLEWRKVTPPELAGFGDPLEGTGAAVALSVVAAGFVSNPTTSIVFAIGSPAATYGQVELGAIAMGRFDPDNGGVTWESGPWYGAAAFGKYGASIALSAAVWSDFGVRFNQRDLLVGQPAFVQNGGSGVHGRAILWQRDGSNWNNVQTFDPIVPGFLDGMGSAVAVTRATNETLGTIALGAPGRSLDGNPGGSVLIYRQTAIDSAYFLDQEIQHADAASADRFGGALALHGNRLLVGADGRAVDLANNAGSAYVYQYQFNPVTFESDWKHRQTLIEARPFGGNALFGRSVALGAHAAAIGAPLSDAAGLTNAGRVATYLCDHIFSDGVETGSASNACGGP